LGDESNDKMTVYEELEGMWKKSVMGYFKVVYEYLICRTEEKP
jgi:hypothetical protein